MKTIHLEDGEDIRDEFIINSFEHLEDVNS